MTTVYVYDPIFLKHTHPTHPESEKRLNAIMEQLLADNLLAGLPSLASRAASDEELQYGHDPRLISQIRDISWQGGGYLDPDTYATFDSYEAAAIAVGSLIDLTLAVVDGKYRNGFALVRPPGHHATYSRAMGFCLFSNIAIAAKAAQIQRGLERIAVIDFDVHHGNGTQAILDNDPNILFVSSHQYPFYPGTGGAMEIGAGPALGTMINLPMPRFAGDENFKLAYDSLVIPLLRRFQPQLILVSAGYDAHWNDPLAELGLSLNGLFWISQTLVSLARELCQGKIVFTLEGGYNRQVLQNGVANSLKALLGRTDFVDPFGKSPWPEPDLNPYLSELKRIHKL